MQNEIRKPRIRFEDFEDTWVQYKLRDIGDIKTGPFGSVLHAYDYVNNGMPIITTEHFKTGNLPTSNSGLPQVSGNDYYRLKSFVLKSGDIVFSRVGSIDINALVTSIQDNWLFSSRVLRVRVNKNIDSKYLHYELMTKDVKKDVVNRAVGLAMPSINTGILKDTHIFAPVQTKEQREIGAFLNTLDSFITYNQNKYMKFVNMKSSLLEKMFPRDGAKVPEIRFSGFSDDWEVRSLNEITEFYNGLTYKPTDVCKAGTFVLRSSNVSDGEVVNADNVYVNADIVNCDNVRKGDIIVVVRNGSRSLIGKHAQIKRSMPNTVIGAFMTGIRAEEPSFINALLSTSNFREEVDRNMGATINQITGYMFSKMKFLVPTKDEQRIIGKFFDKLDNMITKQNNKIKLLQNIKQSFLDKMFVS